jgi:hypothetical protein
MARVVAIVLVLLAATPAFAQPARGSATTQMDRRDQLKQQIRTRRAVMLSEALGLDDETALKVSRSLSKFDDEIEKLLVERADLVRRLNGADSIKDPKVLEKLIDDALVNQRGLWNVEEKRIADLRKILTPQKTARLLVVLPAIERKIQNRLRQMLRQANRRRGPAADDDLDDDDQLPDETVAPKRTR